MAEFNLNNAEFGKHLGTLAAFAIKSSNTAVDEGIVEAFSARIAELADQEVSEEEVVASVFGLATVITDATETEYDDLAVTALKAVTGAFGLTDKLAGWIAGWGKKGE